MRHKQTAIAVSAALAALAFAAAVAGAPVSLLAVLGLASIAAPGYVWAEVLLGSRVAGLERVAVAAGLSLAVPVPGGVALFAAGAQLHRTAWASLFAAVTLAGDITLLIRGRHDRHDPSQLAERWKSPLRRVPLRHAVGFGAAAVIAAGAVGLAHAGATRQHYPGFIQLWLAPPNYTTSTVDLGVTNQQGVATSYRLVFASTAHRHSTWTFTLADGQSWRRKVSFDGLTGAAADLYRTSDPRHPYRHVAIAAYYASHS